MDKKFAQHTIGKNKTKPPMSSFKQKNIMFILNRLVVSLITFNHDLETVLS